MAHLNPTPVLEPGQDRTMILNMGPQHPSTHGVLRVLLEIDGETVVRMMPEIGFLHTGIEKTCEAKFYQQVVPLTDRIDYLCPMTNNLCYVPVSYTHLDVYKRQVRKVCAPRLRYRE